LLKITENGYEKIDKKFKELESNIDLMKSEFKEKN
jgi:hypothetical protein